MKGIIYCRVSSAEQVQGTSLENQRESCLQYAQKNNIEIGDFFIEKGESATAATRTELIRALDYCKRHRGQVAAFIVWKIDRFARNTIDHYALQAELRNYGTTLHSVTEPIGDNPIGKMTEAVLAGYAQFENDIRKQRCEGGMRRKITEGIWPWTPPLGYIHGKKRTDRRKNTPDEADPERFALVQRGLQEFAAGGLTISSLTRLWNRWGLRTRTNKPMFNQLTERLLKDKYLAGILTDPWTHEEHPGLHTRMITVEDYDRIQCFKNPRARGLRAPRFRNNPDFPLRHFVSCTCRRQLTGAWYKGRSKKYAYYVCHNGACPLSGCFIQKERLEAEFKKALSLITPRPDVWKVAREAILASWTSTDRQSALRSTSTDKELADLEHRKKELLQLRLDGEITSDEYLIEKRAIELKATDLTLQRPEHVPANTPLEAHLRRVDTYITKLPDLWDQLRELNHKQALQRVVYPNGMIYNANARAYQTATLAPLFSLFGHSDEHSSYLVAGVCHYIKPILRNILAFSRVVEDFEREPAPTAGLPITTRPPRKLSPISKSEAGSTLRNLTPADELEPFMLFRHYRPGSDGHKAT